MCGGRLAGAQTVSADVWDLDRPTMRTTARERTTSSTHGLVQVHDLAAEAAVVDQDWYAVTSAPYSSYEVLADGLTGDLLFLDVTG